MTRNELKTNFIKMKGQNQNVQNIRAEQTPRWGVINLRNIASRTTLKSDICPEIDDV